eukprot:jgi/Bigna1/82880/fgenesh1_pg.98_\
MPMYPCQGSFCVEYQLEGGSFRGVLDTGSPFLIVDGTACSDRWGCYGGQGKLSQLEATYERYASQEGEVEWRRGKIEFGRRSLGEVIFGVFQQVEGTGGDGAALVGLVKEARRGIRPTLLQQTNVKAMRFDFPNNKFSMSNSPMVPRKEDAIKVYDARRIGSPVKHYITRVENLVINGEKIRSDLPIYAMVDTGTTGLYISDEFFYNILRRSKGFRNCRVDVKTERHNLQSLSASRPNPHFLVFPVKFPWLDESKAHLIVLGLAFLENGEITFDVDDGRISFHGDYPNPPKDDKF